MTLCNYHPSVDSLRSLLDLVERYRGRKCVVAYSGPRSTYGRNRPKLRYKALTPQLEQEILALFDGGQRNQRAIADKTGISQPNVCRVLQRHHRSSERQIRSARP